ncbi:hypothetical protein B0H13DRAFT_2674442 [Mycena leptocephala]|nr:hypothetical protein B0H13DRAFT_2674442 [Mycena leptocephala]
MRRKRRRLRTTVAMRCSRVNESKKHEAGALGIRAAWELVARAYCGDSTKARTHSSCTEHPSHPTPPARGHASRPPYACVPETTTPQRSTPSYTTRPARLDAGRLVPYQEPHSAHHDKSSIDEAKRRMARPHPAPRFAERIDAPPASSKMTPPPRTRPHPHTACKLSWEHPHAARRSGAAPRLASTVEVRATLEPHETNEARWMTLVGVRAYVARGTGGGDGGDRAPEVGIGYAYPDAPPTTSMARAHPPVVVYRMDRETAEMREGKGKENDAEKHEENYGEEERHAHLAQGNSLSSSSSSPASPASPFPFLFPFASSPALPPGPPPISPPSPAATVGLSNRN